MGIVDRIFLTLYTFIMALMSILVVLCSLEVFPKSAMNNFLNYIPGNWMFAVGGIIVLLVSLRLLITGLGFSGQTSMQLSEGPNGKVHVGKTALEDYIAALSQEIYGIYNVKVVVNFVEEMINVRINASIEPGINIPATTGEIKANVRDSIKKVTGIDVKEIEIFFKQIKSQDK